MSDEGRPHNVRATIELQVTEMVYVEQIMEAHLIAMVHQNFLTDEEAGIHRHAIKACRETIEWFQRNQHKVKRGLALLQEQGGDAIPSGGE